jgi:hypothetical protein
MRIPDWWPELLSFRPRSAYQSFENPLQLDRLPDTSKVELDLPTRKYTEEQDRSYVWKFLWLVALVGAGFGLWETNYSTRLAPDVYENWAFMGALALFLYFEASIGRRLWLFVPLLLAAGFLMSIVVDERHEMLTTPWLFLIATVCAVRLVDRIVHLKLYLVTTAPTPKESARRQRAGWRWRFLIPFVPGPLGLDFYLLGLLIAVAPAAVVYYLQPTNSTLPGAQVLAITLALVFATTVALEWIGSYLVGRNPLPPARMWRGMWSCLRDWLTYDRHDSKSPGVFKSPLGSHRQRWWMAFASVLMLAIAVAQLTGWWRAIFERWNRQAKEQAAVTGTAPQRSFITIRDTSIDVTDVVERPATEESFITEDGGHHYLTTAAEPYEPAQPHGFGFRISDEELNEEVRRRREARQFYDPTRAKRFTEALGAAPSTGSYVEDQEKRDQASEYRVLGIIHAAVIWFYPVAAAAIVPGWLLFVYVFAVASRFAGVRLREAAKPRDPPELATADDWERIVGRLRASDDGQEKESVFVGVNAHDHTPVLVPTKVFHEHAHILGDSGSGKTAMGLAPLMTQLIRFEEHSIVIIDLKADEMSLFLGAKEEAEKIRDKWRDEDEKNGRAPREFPFRWFTTELGKCTHVFNPLQQTAFQHLSLSQKTDLLTAALGTQYGTDYGRSYFSDANAELVRLTLHDHPDVRSFKELAAAMADAARRLPQKQREAASHVRTIVNRLADTEALNVAGNGESRTAIKEKAIDFVDVFRRPQALYFYLPSALGTTSNAEIARLALYSLLTAAKHAAAFRPTNGEPHERTQVFLFIDEFQRIVSQNLELFLQQARSMNIGVILANQTLADLDTGGVNLIPSVRANCRFKQMFSVTDVREQEELTRAGGEMMILNQGITRQFEGYFGIERGYSLSATEEQANRIGANEILLAGDHQHHSIVQIRRGAGYAQFGGMPFVLYSQFHIDYDTYNNRRLGGWPAPEEGTIMPSSGRRPTPPAAESAGDRVSTPPTGTAESAGPAANFADRKRASPARSGGSAWHSRARCRRQEETEKRQHKARTRRH